MGMSGEVWRFRVDEHRQRNCQRKPHVNSGAGLGLKWQQVDPDVVEGVFGPDGNSEDNTDDSDNEEHHGGEESDAESNGSGGSGMMNDDGVDHNDSDGENKQQDNEDAGGNLDPPNVPNLPNGAWQLWAAAAMAAGGAHNAAHAAQAAVQAAMVGAQQQVGVGGQHQGAVGGGGLVNLAAGFDANGNPIRPSPRCAASWTCVPGSNKIYLFGGLGSENDFLGDLWCFHAGARFKSSWERLQAVRESGNINEEVEGQPSSIPAGRWGHTMVEHKGILYMFGGSSPGQAYTGLWRLDVSVRPCRWALLASHGQKPPARGGHSATVVRDTLYIFGGNITQVRVFLKGCRK